ncbi:MAG: glycosyltransferase, partial [Nitrospirales bacterium]
MTWFVFCYWYEPDAIRDPVGLVRIWSLSRHLARQGDGVTVFPPRYASAKGHREFRTTAVPLLHVPWLRPLSYALGAFVRGVLAAVRTRPDVVYYRWMESPHVLLLARLIGSLCVCEISGEPVPGWMKEGRGLKARIREGLARFALRRCDRLVVLTEGLRALLVSRYDVAPQRIIVLPSGTDTDRFLPQDRSTCRRRVGLKPERRYIGFVGTFYRYQGLTDLLEALS